MTFQPKRPTIGDWDYRHHNETPIVQLATGLSPVKRSDGSYFFKRGETVVSDHCSPAYLNGFIGTVVALQTSAVVVQLNDASPLQARGSKFVDADGCVRFSSENLRDL